jgi:hypothetical protein
MRGLFGKSAAASSIGVLIGLSACAPVGPQVVNSYGPDWKSGFEFQQDHAYCKMTTDRFQNNLPLYAQCMLSRGNAVQYDNGSIIYPSNSYVQLVPPAPSPPSITPSNSPEENAPASSAPQSNENEEVPTSSTPETSLTPQQKEQLLPDAAIQFGKAYLECLGAEHKARCIAPRWILGMAPDTKVVICSNPSVLQQFITDDELRNAITGLLECPS